MRFLRRLVKILALGLAVLIIGSMMWAVFSVVGWTSMWHSDESASCETAKVECAHGEYTRREVSQLVLEVGAASVEIAEVTDGPDIRFETDNRYIKAELDGKFLKIGEESHHFWNYNTGAGKLRIYVREGVLFDAMKIEVGAGELKLGLSEIKDFDLRVGAGKAEVQARVLGRNEIEVGAGRLELNLIGTEDDYRVQVEKGLGSVIYQGESFGDSTVRGTGVNEVRIEAGLGSVEIKLEQEYGNR